MVLKFLLSTISTILLFIFIILPVASYAAAEEFATSYDIIYDVGLDGVTEVTEKITLRNLTSQYYATQFSLTIGATQISDVFATDPAGPLEVKQEQKGTSTSLTVKFNQQVAGKDKLLPWTLKFKSKDFASKLGKVWEVSIPKIGPTSNLEKYDVTLAIPTSFGSLSQISPTPKKQSSGFDKLFLSFNMEQLKNSGVSANFGSQQIFDFSLTYHLENSRFMPILTNIALPPDTVYQDVIYSQIEPKPINVTVDLDGNYLAWYKLSRNQKIDVKALGSAKLYADSKAKNPSLSPTIRQKYLVAEKFWEKDNQAIKTKLTEILGESPPKTNLDKARLIHRFVVNYLQYDTSRLKNNQTERLGAVTALNNPDSSVCMEFTDLFIALARAAGVPARELDGFAYTANLKLRPLSLSKDILHAWPEIFDEEKGWVMIDPTWEATTGGVDYFDKFDLNHFVFAIRGVSSEQPFPAQDVKVELADKDFLGKAKLDAIIDAPDTIMAGFPSKIKVKITNFGNALEQQTVLLVNTGQLTILEENSQNTGPIPAFGKAEFEYNLRTKSLLENYDDVIEVLVGGQKFRKQVEVRPFVIFRYFPWVLIGLVSLIGLTYFSVLATFIIRRRIRV